MTAGELSAARDALAFVKEQPGLYSTVGVHPTRAGVFKECEQGMFCCVYCVCVCACLQSVNHTLGEEQYLAGLLEVAKEGQRLGKVGECVRARSVQ